MRGIALAILVAGSEIGRAVRKDTDKYSILLDFIPLFFCLACIAAGW
jgi:hypothetical protein